MNFATFRKKAFRVVRVVWCKMNDFYLNIETSDEADCLRPRLYGLPNDMAKHKDGRAYQAADYRNIRRTIRALALNKDDIFYDLGCGKGRAVCIFARRAIRKVVGVELNSLLCNIARVNANRLRGKKTIVEIHCEDAAKADISDGTIYFMFNPFGADTMRAVLACIEHSLMTNPRKVTVVYSNPILAENLRATGWLQQVHEFDTITGGRYVFWSNRKGAGAY